MPKYIFVSGGVISGLGKGITAASMGLLLKSRGIRATNVKIDMYLNVDAGTIRPQEHGEVFVTDDGVETDQDIGHYERFLNESFRRENYMTTGQVYKAVIERERAFGYNGEDVKPQIPIKSGKETVGVTVQNRFDNQTGKQVFQIALPVTVIKKRHHSGLDSDIVDKLGSSFDQFPNLNLVSGCSQMFYHSIATADFF